MGASFGIDSNSKYSLTDFDIIRLLGKGAFGKVWLVQHKKIEQYFAMKVIDKDSVIKQNLIEHTILERDVMLMCNNPFIINLHCTFQSDKTLNFILDYIPGGSLWDYLCKHPDNHLPEKDAIFYIAEIILGIEELHKNNIVYRDLKPENILIQQSGHIVLTDFGLSHNVKRSGKVHSFSGTAIYIAPEVLKSEGHNYMVDCWSLGVVLYILLTGEPPFWSQNRKELFELITSAEIKIDHPLLSQYAKDLISQLLVRDASKRLGATNGIEDIKNHHFFSIINWDSFYNMEYTPPFIPQRYIEQKSKQGKEMSLQVKKTHRRNRSLDVFQDFSFIAEKTELPEKSTIERTKLFRVFTDTPDILKPKKKSSGKIRSKEDIYKKDDVILRNDITSVPTRLKKKKMGHRRSRSQDTRINIDKIDTEILKDNESIPKKGIKRFKSVKKISRIAKKDKE